ncbi:hypothetical protein ABPG74_020334 [Tetrahymena malaccensis]
MARESDFNRKKLQNTKIRRDRAKNIKKQKKANELKKTQDAQKNEMNVEEAVVLDKKGRRELRKKQIKLEKKERLRKFREERQNEINEEQ